MTTRTKAEPLSARLRRLREAAGLRPGTLARKAGMTRIQYSRIERGERSMHVDTAVALARALGVSLDLLLTGRE